MAVSIDAIKQLRSKTGVGMIDAKKALDEAGGDIEKAIEWLKKHGAVKAAKKSDRETKEGLIHSYIHAGGKVGVLVEVNCETDFVARNEEFVALCQDIAMHIAASDPQYLSKEDVPEEVIAKEKEIAKEQLSGEGKDDTIIEKALPGRIEKFYQEVCLLEQGFIKDEAISINQLVSDKIAVLGENIKINRFIRYSL
jgi:elongation factor Ts